MRAAAVVLLAAAPALAGGTPTPEPSASPTPRAVGASPRASASEMTEERALAIARKKIAAFGPDAAFVVLEDKTIEKPFGWVFFYEPKAAASDPSAMVPGAGPLVVHRADGSTAFLSTSVPPQDAIAEYEKVWARRKNPKP